MARKARELPQITVRTLHTNPSSRRGDVLVRAHTDLIEKYLATGIMVQIEDEVPVGTEATLVVTEEEATTPTTATEDGEDGQN